MIAVASANMLPAIHGRARCNSQKPYSIIASSIRFGCPRSNWSKTKVTVTKPGTANNQGPGILPDPVMALENWPAIHHAMRLSSDRQI